ncbi:MAG: hypothetical protein AAGE52_25470 [Myxococcota bacterium]
MDLRWNPSAVLFVTLLASCGSDNDPEVCTTRADCASGEVCVLGVCEELPDGALRDSGADTSVSDATADVVLDVAADAPADASADSMGDASGIDAMADAAPDVPDDAGFDAALSCSGIADGDACCPASCGSCGGFGCAERPGGATNCCFFEVLFSGRSCAEFEPPCVLLEEPPEDPCASGVRAGDICCAASCGTCAGEGCDTRPGGASACCRGPILASGRVCSGVEPPCVIDALEE